VRGDRADAEDLVTGRIFISYRRGDDQAAAGRLYDRLLQHFDHEQLFMDVDAIEPGVDFVKSLDEQVAACMAFIAVIGPRWLDARNDDGNRGSTTRQTTFGWR
jgi:TIR domain